MTKLQEDLSAKSVDILVGIVVKKSVVVEVVVEVAVVEVLVVLKLAQERDVY